MTMWMCHDGRRGGHDSGGHDSEHPRARASGWRGRVRGGGRGRADVQGPVSAGRVM